MKTLVSHPTGNANLRAVLRALQGTDALAEFWTAIGLPPEFTSSPWLPQRVRSKLAQRSFSEAPWARTHIRPFREITRLVNRGIALPDLSRHESGWASVDGVYRGLDRAVARRLRGGECSATAVYAYEDGAHETFLAARETGRVCIYDLPIAYWRTLRSLLEEEAERLPDWAPTMEGLQDSEAKHARKDAELALADHVIVASSFTRNSLHAEDKDRPIHVVPYGCPPPIVARPATRIGNAPIQLLFAGHLAQRKGLADLIAALNILDIDWRLTLAGPPPPVIPQPLKILLQDRRVTWLGVVPHAKLLEHMAKAHMFVFPSIVEGFGMVITEALSAGLPVVTTPHTAGPDILNEGVDGFIVPIRSPESLADRITYLYDDEEGRQAMGEAALTKAADMTWTQYETKISRLVAGWAHKA